MADYELLRAIARQRAAHNLQVRALASPNAGADLNIVVPGGEDWRLIAVKANFTASGVVANRSPSLFFDDGTSVVGVIPSGVALVAGSITTVSFVADLGMGPLPVTANVACASIPAMVLPSGWHIRTSTALLDVGDQWSSVTVTFEMMNEPPYLSPLTGTPEEDAIHDALQAVREGM